MLQAFTRLHDVDVPSGPPGTGKTTTIAAALEECQSAWVIAQSNVAVKNIARALAKDKYNINFKVIVSKEFYVEWLVLPNAYSARC